MATVKAPNKNYAGVSAGVVFENGVGHTDEPYILDWFRSHGYEVEENAGNTAKESEPEKPVKEPEPEKPVKESEPEKPVKESEPEKPVKKKGK